MLSYELIAKSGEVIHDRVVDHDRNLILAERWRGPDDDHRISLYPDPDIDTDEVPAILEVFSAQGA